MQVWDEVQLVSDFSDLLLAAGYIRDPETFGLISELDRPDVETVEKFGDELFDKLELDSEALILEFVPQSSSSVRETFLVVAWWDGDLSSRERATLSDAYREEFLWSTSPAIG